MLPPHQDKIGRFFTIKPPEALRDSSRVGMYFKKRWSQKVGFRSNEAGEEEEGDVVVEGTSVAGGWTLVGRCQKCLEMN